jgi:hypothetical protein
MQAVVERVMRAFISKHHLSKDKAEAVRQEVTDFAAELLEKYQARLEQRAQPPRSH